MLSGLASYGTPCGNWKPSKKKSRERIDGIVALIMGLERASTDVPYDGHLFYLTHDVEIG